MQKKTTSVKYSVEKTEVDGKMAFLLVLTEGEMELCPEDQCQCDTCETCSSQPSSSPLHLHALV